MSIHVNIGGTYREMDKGWVNINGVWREIDSIHNNINGVWREGYTSKPDPLMLVVNGVTQVSVVESYRHVISEGSYANHFFNQNEISYKISVEGSYDGDRAYYYIRFGGLIDFSVYKSLHVEYKASTPTGDYFKLVFNNNATGWPISPNPVKMFYLDHSYSKRTAVYDISGLSQSLYFHIGTESPDNNNNKSVDIYNMWFE